ncbi:MAG: ester cyclase, partial [Mesorhizobium sp.]
MSHDDLASLYKGYIACLNEQDWDNLGQFVGEEVQYNGETVGLSGYRRMLEGDFQAIPD